VLPQIFVARDRLGAADPIARAAMAHCR